MPTSPLEEEHSMQSHISHLNEEEKTNATNKGGADEESSAEEERIQNSAMTKGDADRTSSSSSKELLINSTQWLREHAKEFMDEWTRVGLSRYVDLPMICVLGDTSSGKSSVLSSLIGLELPSASSLTTKCPVLVQLKRTDEADQEAFQAVVDIQWHVPRRRTTGTMRSSRQRKRTIEKNVVGDRDSVPDQQSDSVHRGDVSNTILSPPSSASASASLATPPPPPPPKWKPCTITKDLEAEIPTCIQKAQELILKFRETLVAPDVICISLRSPFCTEELTLVDLPGLVQFQHHHDQVLLGQVEQVVLEYVNNPRSVLLPIVAAPTNIHNSKVLQWCKEVDPLTTRTIPVLTKPDLIDPGSESDVVELLENNKHQRTSTIFPLHEEYKTANGNQQEMDDDSEIVRAQFLHGFYMIKNRGQALLDSGTTLKKGLELEQGFFTTTSPWKSIDKSRLGIPALRNKLSHVLWEVIQSSMAAILDELDDQYQQAKAQLEEMGILFQTKVEQRKFYHSLSQRLVSQISSSLSGKGSRYKPSKTTGIRSKSSSGSSLDMISTSKPAGAARLHSVCHEFFQEIQAGSLATINTLVEGANVRVSSPENQADVRGEIVHIDPNHAYACVDFVDDHDHSTEVLFDGIHYTAEHPDFEEDEVWSDGTRVFIGRTAGHFDSMRKISCSRIRTDPSWLEEKIAQYRTDDLACFVNVDMFQQIVAEFVQDDWIPPCQKLMDNLEQILKDTVEESLKENLASATRFPRLRRMMESKCHGVAKTLLENARNQVKDFLEMEEQHPYTQDEVLMKAMNQARFQALRADLDIYLRLDQEGVVYETKALQTILDQVFAKHQRNNWMAEQMELVLSCYGKVATQRVLDRPPQICWQACRSLTKSLQEELGFVTDDVLEACLCESPESQLKFEALMGKISDIEIAMNVVKNFRQ